MYVTHDKDGQGRGHVSHISCTYTARSTMQGDTVEARSLLVIVYTALYTSQQARYRVGYCATCTRPMSGQGITFGGSNTLHFGREEFWVVQITRVYPRIARRVLHHTISFAAENTARVEPSTARPKSLL